MNIKLTAGRINVITKNCYYGVQSYRLLLMLIYIYKYQVGILTLEQLVRR
jgi:hypothetical protein